MCGEVFLQHDHLHFLYAPFKSHVEGFLLASQQSSVYSLTKLFREALIFQEGGEFDGILEVYLLNDNVHFWCIRIGGFTNSPFEGRTLDFLIVWPETKTDFTFVLRVPKLFPKIYALTKIHHPNIRSSYEEGKSDVCLPHGFDEDRPITIPSLFGDIFDMFGKDLWYIHSLENHLNYIAHSDVKRLREERTRNNEFKRVLEKKMSKRSLVVGKWTKELLMLHHKKLSCYLWK
jgi:hypothetical protein